MGVSRGHDLDALWAQGQRDFDLDALDALLLLESQTVEALDDGRLAQTTHRAVWIGTAAGLRATPICASPGIGLRDPRRAGAAHLARGPLVARRREGERHGRRRDAAHALRTAYDYQDMRETMLLHDGVELPCIMETVYTITLNAEAAALGHGTHVLTQNDPAVLSEFRIKARRDLLPKAKGFLGAPEPTFENDGDTTTSVWSVAGAPARGLPHATDPALNEPHIVWRVWTLWSDGFIKATGLFENQSVATGKTAEALNELVASRITTLDRARAVCELLEQDVRSIHYDDSYWRHAPRNADRVWESGYAHDLDRAVLAAALFRNLGLSADLCYHARRMFTENGATRIGALVGPLVKVSLDRSHMADLVGWYDPARNEILGRTDLMGAAIWNEPGAAWIVETPRESTIGISLELDRDDDGWTGRGELNASGVLSPHRRMTGLDREMLDVVDATAGGLLPGLGATVANPQVFMPEDVEVGFAFDYELPEADDAGRITLTLGDPAHTAMTMPAA